MSDAPALTTAPGDVPGWLRLTLAPRLGPVALRGLLRAFGLPAAILAASPAELRRHLPEATLRALLAPPDAGLQAQIDRTIAWMAEPGHHIVTLADQAYPANLLALPDPPPLLYVRGRLDLLAQPALGIVGARHATLQGTQNAEAFAEALSHAGQTVISGLALGIDAAAHTGALRGRGSTVAVIGTGPDIVYPARNRALTEHIAAAGAILSEFPLGAPASRFHFPRRNRLIAALGQGVLVVEAALQSGSLITARLAAELGREVFAIPGSIHSPLSKGCHRLLRDGAKLVESAQDIFEELQGCALPAEIRRQTRAANPAVTQSLTPDPGHARIPPPDGRPDAPADPLLAALGYDPIPLDALCERLDQAASELTAQLFALELAGHIERLPGNVFRRLR